MPFVLAFSVLLAATVGFAEVPAKLTAAKVSATQTSKRAPTSQTRVQAQSLDASLTEQQLKEAGFETSRPIQLNEIPDPVIRDQYFERAGLSVSIVKLDQFDRDILFMRARRYSSQRLATTYKKLPAPALLRLQKLLGVQP